VLSRICHVTAVGIDDAGFEPGVFSCLKILSFLVFFSVSGFCLQRPFAADLSVVFRDNFLLAFECNLPSIYSLGEV